MKFRLIMTAVSLLILGLVFMISQANQSDAPADNGGGVVVTQ